MGENGREWKKMEEKGKEGERMKKKDGEMGGEREEEKKNRHFVPSFREGVAVHTFPNNTNCFSSHTFLFVSSRHCEC